MSKYARKVIGVTLLEILLVLAIAAMIIIMSIRYYQSSIVAQQTNQTSEMLLAIIAAADSIALAQGTYEKIDSSKIKPLMPGGKLTPPWGGADITIEPSLDNKGLVITLPKDLPLEICNPVRARVAATPNFSTDPDCKAGTGLTINYK